MARPEGYRKAPAADGPGRPLRPAGGDLGRHARRLSRRRCRGARPGRGDRALASRPASKLAVPLVAVIIGEGGSGGAIALAAANRVLMLEHAIYSVISPEGCASILWRSARRGARTAAEALKLTAQDLLRLGVIDQSRAGAAGRRPPRQGRCDKCARRCAERALAGLPSKMLTRLLDRAASSSPGRQERREKFPGSMRIEAATARLIAKRSAGRPDACRDSTCTSCRSRRGRGRCARRRSRWRDRRG